MTKIQASAVILTALEGVRLSADEKQCFEQYPPAGFTLFRRNISPYFSATRELCDELQTLRGTLDLPLLLAIDQEGGRVARLKAPFPDYGPAMNLASGKSDGAALIEIENIAFAMGATLRQLGINVDFAPVLDILTREENVAIGDRCFGRDRESVTLRGGAFLRGLHHGGIMGCIKHFPGQGDAGVDTHETGALITADRAILDEREIYPFQKLIPEAPMVMISHAVYPALDSERPASLSSRVMLDLLRGELGFRGLIVSDDMNMKAIDQSRKPWCEAIIASIAAGADMVLVCRELERYQWAVEAISEEAAKSPAFARRLADANDRVIEVRNRL
ncbi:MAG: glycoside hydrolase family 3 protein [Proteobacteria bacterium]|nr:MAG: glycoside hydrolase family 3 protein [Pseudomonadota bacterium]